ncbi:hypothetical protein ACH4MG_26950 [Streptomyces sp. NPDC017454]|uniref:hypothetical protein n=1 Tax=Streptomyces sp. NPDC017454 TaxID=3364997 RepID=UPI003789397B
MAQNYETEAVVVIDGEEIQAYARFAVDADSTPKWWGGELESDDSALAFKLINGRRASLRLPSGSEASIVPGEDRGRGASFTGSGRPPV